MIDEIIKLIDAYWKFDNDQQHLSTWHDKQDLIEAVKQVKNCNAPAVSVAKHPLPRPMEAWKNARNMELSDYIEWHLEQERRGNAR